MTDLREKLEGLALRCEQATAEQQREMLWQAWQFIRGSTYAPTDAGTVRIQADGPYQRFVKMLDAEAYLDAAMSLVPEGLCFEVGDHDGAWARAIDGSREGFFATAETPALALTAACLRATANREGSDE